MAAVTGPGDDSWTTVFRERGARAALYRDLLATDGVQNVKILSELVDGLSGAFTDLCEVSGRQGSLQILQVFKLSSLADAEMEASGAREVKVLVPRDNCVHLIDLRTAVDQGVGVVRYEYAGRALLPDLLRSFLSFEEATAEPKDAARFIEEALRALSKPLQPIEYGHTSIEEICAHFEGVRDGRFWAGVVEGFNALQASGKVTLHRHGRMLLDFPFKTVHDPFAETPQVRKAWTRLFPGARGAQGHGDLNPRNILAARPDAKSAYVPILIDYHRFGGPVPLALDFARLEAGIQIKTLRKFLQAAEASGEEEDLLTKYEKWIDDHESLSEHAALESGSMGVSLIPRELKRSAMLVSRVRKMYFEVAGGNADLSASYFACLMLWYFNYVRPSYRKNGLLTEGQQLFALFCACRIFRRHFVYPARF